MSAATKKCPMCAEEIPLAAITCEYCGAQFEVTSTGYCQNCHQVRGADENGRCKVCGNPVIDLRVQSRSIDQQPPAKAPSVKIPEPSVPKQKSSRWACIVIPLVVLVIGVALSFSILPKALNLLFPGNSPTIQLSRTPISGPTTIATEISIIPTETSETVENPAEVPSPVETVENPLPTATLTPGAAVPAGSTGTATGRILWNGQPMEAVTVKLCTDWSMIGGCTTTAYTGTSGADGRYTIEGLPAGEYSFATRIPGQKNETGWLGIKVTVVVDQSATVRDVNISKSDLKLSAPGNNAPVTTSTPTLEWEPYPGAAYYKVYVVNNETYDTVIRFEKVSDAQYIFQNPLDPAKYYWSIDAYNANGIKIADSGTSYFVVAP
jgi:hypothetical protein